VATEIRVRNLVNTIFMCCFCFHEFETTTDDFNAAIFEEASKHVLAIHPWMFTDVKYDRWVRKIPVRDIRPDLIADLEPIDQMDVLGIPPREIRDCL